MNGRSIDSKPPEVSINSPVSEKIFGTDDQVTISWEATDNWILGWAKSYYRYSSSKDFVFIDSSDTYNFN